MTVGLDPQIWRHVYALSPDRLSVGRQLYRRAGASERTGEVPRHTALFGSGDQSYAVESSRRTSPVMHYRYSLYVIRELNGPSIAAPATMASPTMGNQIDRIMATNRTMIPMANMANNQ